MIANDKNARDIAAELVEVSEKMFLREVAKKMCWKWRGKWRGKRVESGGERGRKWRRQRVGRGVKGGDRV